MEVSTLVFNIGSVVALVIGAISFTWKVGQIKSIVDSNFIIQRKDLEELKNRFDKHGDTDDKWKIEAESKMKYNADRIELINTNFMEIKTILTFIQSDLQEIKKKGNA